MMTNTTAPLRLPDYHTFIDSIDVLSLPISGSELHGVMCGYLCAGAINKGESYLRALMNNRGDAGLRRAALALFGVYAVSQQQLVSFDFEFQLLLPDDHEALAERAQAFSEWCEGFTQGITLAGVGYEQLQEEEAQEALEHMTEFAQLDYHTLHIDEEDEHALMEVSEYARMAVLRIYGDLHASKKKDGSSETAH
jgi:uncharacterized protein YgfB (UPF0149 family)